MSPRLHSGCGFFAPPAGESARSPLPKTDAGRNVAGRGQNMRGGKLQIPLRNFSDAQGSFRNPPGASCACRNAMPPDAARRQIRGIAREAPQSLPECACFCRNMEIPGVLRFRDWVGKPTRRVLSTPRISPPCPFSVPLSVSEPKFILKPAISRRVSAWLQKDSAVPAIARAPSVFIKLTEPGASPIIAAKPTAE